MADSGGGGGDDASGGGGGGGGEGLPQLEEDMEARIKRSEARAERSRKRGSLGMELPERDCRRKIGCRLMNLGNSCYQNCVLQILVNLPDVRARLVEFAGRHQDCEEELCFSRELARHAAQVPEAAAKGQAISATWILKYQQELGGDVLMGELFRQSDPACFLHAAAEWCVDRAASPAHQLSALHDFFQGEAYEHEWVDSSPGAFPKCQAGPKDLPSQPFLMLNIPIPAQPATLEACLAEGVFADQVVSGRECDDAAHCPYGRQEGEGNVNKGHNGGAGAENAKKPPRHDTHQQLRLAKLPRYLCFRLLRFDNSLKKIRTPISYPEHLDLAHVGAVLSPPSPPSPPPPPAAAKAPATTGGGGRSSSSGGGSGSGRASPRLVAAAAAVVGAGKEGDEEGKGEGAAEGGGGPVVQAGGEGSLEYDLMAVVVHQGRTRQRGHYYLYHRVLEGGGGHYLDYKKKRSKGNNNSHNQQDNHQAPQPPEAAAAAVPAAGAGEGEEGEEPMASRWWLFDDAKRHDEVDPPRVLKAQDEVYMLVYRRREGHGAPAATAAAAAAGGGSGGKSSTKRAGAASAASASGSARCSPVPPPPPIVTAGASPPRSPKQARQKSPKAGEGGGVAPRRGGGVGGRVVSPVPTRQSPRSAAAAAAAAAAR